MVIPKLSVKVTLIIYLIIAIILILFLCKNVYSVDIPPNSKIYLPVLKEVANNEWPEFKTISVFAGQVEQETCISLTHKKCWNPKAELKTSREYGFGLGQITITSKFDNFKEIKKMSKKLSKWEYTDRYNAKNQLIGLVAMDKYQYNLAKKWGADEFNTLCFALSAYNGGLGGVMKDRQLCKTKPNCNPNVWFGNVADNSYKAKKAVSGYGKSFYEINREYVSNILDKRRYKYVKYVE